MPCKLFNSLFIYSLFFDTALNRCKITTSVRKRGSSKRLVGKVRQHMSTSKMTHIGILVPVCSRNQYHASRQDIPFFKYLLPSLQKTMEESDFKYSLFVGCDDNDTFYLAHRHWFEDGGCKFITLKNCQHAPALAWNQLYRTAIEYHDTIHYFFQLSDDVVLENKWTTPFVEYLQSKNNLGVTGPCDVENYRQRIYGGRQIIIENAFVSRKHNSIFQTFFHPSIKNWYCDDWITGVYNAHDLAQLMTNIECKNSIRDHRYTIEACPAIEQLIREGSKKLTEVLTAIPSSDRELGVMGNHKRGIRQ